MTAKKSDPTPACASATLLNGKHDIGAIVDRLHACNIRNGAVRNAARKPLPSREEIISIVETLRSVVFPRCFGPQHVEAASLKFHLGSMIDKIYHTLKEQIHRGLCFECDGTRESCTQCEVDAEEAAGRFIERIPEIAEMMNEDVQATFVGDPAAKSVDEIIFCYPGVTATLAYRIAHELYALSSPIIARIISEYAHTLTGIDIHPGARIGHKFMIDHGTGVVIGETTTIGANVRIYQGVTLGAKSFPLDADGNPIKGVKRHPDIQDDVIIYSGATILGPVSIGKGAVIGGNVWLTESVPAGTRIVQGRVSKEHFLDGAGI
ncbi:MAG: serine acetyltransferase [Myxococcales bacterium]|nr:MAG: serine acetyltransferase [Myxococcales bacterium]